MIYKRFLHQRFYTQDNIVEAETVINDIKNNKFVFQEDVFLKHFNKPSSYDFSSNHINIPKNYFRNDINYKQYISIEKVFNDKSLEFIISHEVGHLNNHQFLSLHSNKYTEIFILWSHINKLII